MNKKRFFIIVGVVLFAMVAWYFGLDSKQGVDIVTVQSPKVAEEKKQSVEVSQPEKVNFKKPVAKNIGEYMASHDADPEMIERIIKVRKFQNLKIAEFDYYGKVVDQHGEPVVGAKVIGYYTYYPLIPNGDFSSSTKNIEVFSDENGLFSFTKQKGRSISINSIEKTGYEFEAGRTYIFSRGGIKMLKAIGNPDKPVIFHAWKKGESEPLVQGEYRQKFRTAGGFESINIPGLDSGLSVRFDLDPNGKPYKPENWGITLKAKAGGIVESNNEVFMNLAPESGYLPIWSKSYVKGTNGFTDEDRKKFYFRSGNNYGRMEVNYVAYYKKGYAGILRIKYWINPNGSRNLQYDPRKRIPLNR